MPTHRGPAWLEGMRLQPHHFQQLEIATQNAIQYQTNLISKNRWGLDVFNYEVEVLEKTHLIVQSVHGLFPNGWQLHYEITQQPALSIELDTLTDNTVIYIQPLLKNTQPNYRLIESLEDDICSEQQNIQSLIMKQVQYQLCAEAELEPGTTAIPLLKVTTNDDGKKFISKYWYGPVISALSNPVILKKHKDLLFSLTKKQSQLSSQLTQTELNLTTGLHINALLMSTLNRYSLNLKLFNGDPEELYHLLTNLYAELAVFYTKNRTPNDVPIYQHKQQLVLLTSLYDNLNLLLSHHAQCQAVPIKLDSIDANLWQGNTADKELFEHADWFVSIQLNEAPEQWQSDIVNYLKFTAPSETQDAYRLNIPGIDVSVIKTLPPQLPYLDNSLYLKLNQTHPQWQHVIKEQSLNIKLEKSYESINLRLWAVAKIVTGENQ